MKKLPTASEIARHKGLPILKIQAKDKDEWVPLGRVLGAHGIRGALKIHLDNPDGLSADEGAELGFLLKSGEMVIMRVASRLPGNRIFFEDISDRNEAEAFKGALLFIHREDMPALLENEVYLVDLLHSEALDVNGAVLGEVIGFTDNRAQILAEIKTKDGQRILLPFVAPILQEIDEAKKRIVFDPPSGFFDEC